MIPVPVFVKFASLFVAAALVASSVPVLPILSQDGKKDKAGPSRFEIGRVFPPPLRADLKLTTDQENELTAIEKGLKDQLNELLSDEQKKAVASFRQRGPDAKHGEESVPARSVENSSQRSAPKKDSPNIIVIIADDLGWGDPSMHKGISRTPNLDRLAKDGVDLQRFYGYPVCSPTRAAFLSGVMPRRLGISGIVGPRGEGLPTTQPTLPRTLQSAGYETFLIGKWHLGQNSPLKCGFDHFYGFMGAEVDYYKHTDIRQGTLDWQRNGKPVEEEGYSTFLFADEAIRLIDKRDPKRPFFLEVAFNAPHFPLVAPAEYIAKYKDLPQRLATYAAVITALDDSIGRILEALEKQKLSANTLVVFFSDNGAPAIGSNAPFRGGKTTVFEGGIRTPCVMRWPGKIKPGTVSQQAISAQDFFPTLAAVADVSIKDEWKLDGKNLWPAICNGTVQDRGSFIIATTDAAVFDGDWKLIQTATGKQSLYQITKDPGEKTDLLAENPEIVKRLEAKLAEAMKEWPEVRKGPKKP